MRSTTSLLVISLTVGAYRPLGTSLRSEGRKHHQHFIYSEEVAYIRSRNVRYNFSTWDIKIYLLLSLTLLLGLFIMIGFSSTGPNLSVRCVNHSSYVGIEGTRISVELFLEVFCPSLQTLVIVFFQVLFSPKSINRYVDCSR